MRAVPPRKARRERLITSTSRLRHNSWLNLLGTWVANASAENVKDDPRLCHTAEERGNRFPLIHEWNCNGST